MRPNLFLPSLMMFFVIATGIPANATPPVSPGAVLPPPSPAMPGHGLEPRDRDATEFGTALVQPQLPCSRIPGNHRNLAACFAPGTPWEYVQLVDEALFIEDSMNDDGNEDGFEPRYQLGGRWSGSAGTPRALTWSFVPDGLSIGSGVGEPTANSELFSRMDSLFSSQGGRATWIARIQSCFDRWAILTGVSYTRITVGGNDWDDGASWGTGGSAGLRGDVRISMKNIDGNSGVLAYNFFPSSGDMVLDRSEAWNSSTNTHRFLRNTFMHEHGHGIGLQHVCPIADTKLMEPFLSTDFDGPQHDDIRGGQRHYGDDSESNDTSATAEDIGTLVAGTPINLGAVPAPGNTSTWPLSIDRDGAIDFYRFTVNAAVNATVTVAPVGSTYLAGPETGNCTTGNSTNSLAMANLNVQFIGTNGSTVLATGNSAASGSPEILTGSLAAPGNYYLRVYEGDSPSQSQMYTIRLTATVANPPADPPAPTSNSPGCGTVTLTRSGSPPAGITWYWQNLICGTLTNLGSGPTFNVTASGTYFIRAQDNVSLAWSAGCGSVVVVVTPVPSTPTSPQADPSTICAGQQSSLTATVSSGVTVDWYTASCGGTLVGTGSPLLVMPTVTTTYFGRARNTTSNCESVNCAEVTVTVGGALAAPTSPLASPATICAGQSSTISATVPGGQTVDWFTGSCGGTAVGSGTSLVVNPTVTTTYFGRARDTSSGCTSATCAQVTVTVNAAPAAPTSPSANPATICAGQSSTISATVPGGQAVDWFTGSCGGTDVGSGTSLVVNPTVTTTYFGRARNTTTGCNSATCAQVTVTVNAAPAAPTSPSANPATICAGQSSTISATVPGGQTVDWFTGSCGGTSVGTGTSLVVNPTVTTTYFARARNSTTGCTSATCAQVTVTVNAAPAAPTSPSANPATICAGQSSTISATVPGGQTVDWFTGSCGGTSVGTGTSLVVNPTVTTTYFGRARDTTTGCVSTTCAQVTVTVSTPPDAPTAPLASPPEICLGQSSTISATAPGGTTIDWFTVSCGGTAIGTGSSLVVSPTVTTTYFGRARNLSGGCTSATCAAVVVTVDPLPAIAVFINVTLGIDTDPMHQCLSDINHDGLNDGDDIGGYVARLVGP